ncbi:MAG: LamG-like jellyroll fold domain-containing protein [Akkermansiaceae bacterium]
MTPSPLTDEQRSWIEHTLLNVKLGQATANDVGQLRAMLLESQEARSIYLRFNQMDCLLSASYQETALQQAPELILDTPWQSTAKPKTKATVWTPTLIGAGIAAMIALVFSLIVFNNKTEDTAAQPAEKTKPIAKPIAKLEAEYDAHFNGESVASTITFEKGALFLDRGIAQLAFNDGTQVVFDGKCDFKIVGESTVLLTQGKLWLNCPADSNGFKIRTPDKEIRIRPSTEMGTEITDQGSSNAHVYRGRIKITDSDKNTKSIVTSEATKWQKNSMPQLTGRANFEKFTTSGDIIKARLRAHQREMLTRNDLLLYYDFSGIKNKTVFNKCADPISGSNGLTLGTTQASGRAGNDNALQFKNPGDGVKLHVKQPNQATAITIALWVNIDQLPSAISTLMNSDGWEPGSIHFQVTRSRSIKIGVNGGAAFESGSSSFDTGRWHLLATTLDFQKKKAQLYCDGVKLKTFRINNGTQWMPSLKPQLGICQIGSWDKDLSHTSPKETIFLNRNIRNRLEPKTSEIYKNHRDLKGRIDEVMIFNRALSGEEMSKLYRGNAVDS